jgi:polyphenol oxidase
VALPPGARGIALDGGIRAAWSDASRGDLRPVGILGADAAPLARFVADVSGAATPPIADVAWTVQIHGSSVEEFETSRPSGSARPARLPEVHRLGEHDALVSSSTGVAVCVLTADCGALALASPEGVFAVVHAGWRGLAGGVVEAAVARMRQRGATDVVGALGPSIHPGCYEFGADALDTVAATYGDRVRGRTDSGRPALDLGAGIAAALDRAGARSAIGVDVCTACGGGYFSHRARGDAGRQALVVWADAEPSS